MSFALIEVQSLLCWTYGVTRPCLDISEDICIVCAIGRPRYDPLLIGAIRIQMAENLCEVAADGTRHDNRFLVLGNS